MYSTGIPVNVMRQPYWYGVWGGWIHRIHMADNLQCSPEVTTALLVGYIPTQTESLKK